MYMYLDVSDNILNASSNMNVVSLSSIQNYVSTT